MASKAEIRDQLVKSFKDMFSQNGELLCDLADRVGNLEETESPDEAAIVSSTLAAVCEVHMSLLRSFGTLSKLLAEGDD